MNFILTRISPNVFTFGFFGLMALALGVTRDYPITSLAMLAGSAFCFYAVSATTGEQFIRNGQVKLMAAAFYLPALLTMWLIFDDESERRHFKRYLAVHDCVQVDEELSLARPAGCDSRAGTCDDVVEHYEPVYLCQNGNRITFKDFANDEFGVPNDL